LGKIFSKPLHFLIKYFEGEPQLKPGTERAASNFMAKEHFDQFKNNMLKLSQDAGVLGDQYNELKNTNDMVVRLAKKQKRQMELLEEDRQKTHEEIKIIKLELQKAQEKIKALEQEILESKNSVAFESDADEIDSPDEDTFDLELLANDVDTKLAIKEEEETFNYLKKMDMGL